MNRADSKILLALVPAEKVPDPQENACPSSLEDCLQLCGRLCCESISLQPGFPSDEKREQQHEWGNNELRNGA